MLCLKAIYNIILHIQYNPIRQHEQQKDNRNNIVCLLPLMYCFCCPFPDFVTQKTLIFN